MYRVYSVEFSILRDVEGKRKESGRQRRQCEFVDVGEISERRERGASDTAMDHDLSADTVQYLPVHTLDSLDITDTSHILLSWLYAAASNQCHSCKVRPWHDMCQGSVHGRVSDHSSRDAAL